MVNCSSVPQPIEMCFIICFSFVYEEMIMICMTLMRHLYACLHMKL